MLIDENKAMNPGELRFMFKISKVDEETREVEGVATSEVIDSHGEILQYAGSKKAIKNWVGNIREMHQPKAVGKRVGVTFDDANKKIFVRAYISKGAQDTFEKVKDGTLSYYSVGGTRISSTVKPIEEIPPECIKGTDQPPEKVRVTDSWKMSELSLVDSGANPESGIALVKETNGQVLQTEAVEDDPEAEQREAERKERRSLPKSSYAFVAKDGKGHYPIKNKSGECSPVLVREALAKVTVARAKGGEEAEIAEKAMPAIRAAAKKLQIQAFKSDISKFLAIHDVLAVKLDDGTEIVQDTPISRDQLENIAGFMKYGSYAMTFNVEVVDFDTAYQRYQEDCNLEEVYDILYILNQVLVATVFNADMTEEERNSAVAKNVEQFVSIFMDAANRAASKSDPVGDLKEIQKAIEEALVGAENKEVVNAESIKAMIQASLSAESLGKVIAGAISPISDRVEKLSTDLTAKLEGIDGRLKKVEETPVTKNAPAVRVVERDGRSQVIAKSNIAGAAAAMSITKDGDDLVLTENDIEYRLPEVMKEIGTLEKELSEMPAADPNRLKKEVRAIALHRIRKILSGDKVWR